MTSLSSCSQTSSSRSRSASAASVMQRILSSCTWSLRRRRSDAAVFRLSMLLLPSGRGAAAVSIPLSFSSRPEYILLYSSCAFHWSSSKTAASSGEISAAYGSLESGSFFCCFSSGLSPIFRSTCCFSPSVSPFRHISSSKTRSSCADSSSRTAASSQSSAASRTRIS